MKQAAAIVTEYRVRSHAGEHGDYPFNEKGLDLLDLIVLT